MNKKSRNIFPRQYIVGNELLYLQKLCVITKPRFINYIVCEINPNTRSRIWRSYVFNVLRATCSQVVLCFDKTQMLTDPSIALRPVQSSKGSINMLPPPPPPPRWTFDFLKA